jgi:L-cysteine S-thiosulfotransferase
LGRGFFPALIAGTLASGAMAADIASSLEIVGDGIPKPLAAARGDSERGRALVVERGAANCLLCHAVPDPTFRVAGNVGPSLAGVGRRLTPAQLRLRIADIQRIKRDAVMPSYYRTSLDRVAADYRGQPVLDAQQVEDLVAYLETLK